MIDAILEWDRELFHFCNTTLATPVGDVLWPIVTHYDRFPAVRIALLVVWILLIAKGGRRGRMAAVILLPVIVLSDQLNSNVIKELVGRPRPCHLVNGVPIMTDIRMLVDCGPGFAFTSSHAVNNAAAATVLSHYYPRWSWAFILWAALVALSRVFVGVHYPLDVVSGAIVGAGIAFLVIVAGERAVRAVSARFSAPRGEGRA